MLTLIKQIICRGWCIIGSLLCLIMIGGALLLQYAMGLSPCSLCIIQRVAVIAALIVFVIGAIHNPRGKGGIVYGFLALIISIAGALVALRQVWIQLNPPADLASCGPGLQYLFQALPFWQALSYVLYGSGDCSRIEGQFLGITLPGWSFLAFLVLILVSLLLIISAASKKRRQRLF